jgi:hypothetical protein
MLFQGETIQRTGRNFGIQTNTRVEDASSHSPAFAVKIALMADGCPNKLYPIDVEAKSLSKIKKTW